MTDINTLAGLTMTKVEQVGYDELHMHCTDGRLFKFYHRQDCCEVVYIESIVGDLEDLVGEPILIAEEAISDNDPEGYINTNEYRESFTWTFYKFATRKGYVDIRWLGESDGYSTESVYLAVIGDKDD